MSQTTRIDLSRDIDDVTPGILALRRALHQHPELAFEEVWTATTLAGRMRSLGLPVQEGIGGTGVLAVLEGARPGRTLLVRADMDALPMDDTTGREYASMVANRNHACGHDVHCAVVAGVAELGTPVLGRSDLVSADIDGVHAAAMNANFTRSPWRRRPSLFLGCRAPCAACGLLAATDPVPRLPTPPSRGGRGPVHPHHHDGGWVLK
jgi:hypothetical protein